jgi:hypothetical protein
LADRQKVFISTKSFILKVGVALNQPNHKTCTFSTQKIKKTTIDKLIFKCSLTSTTTTTTALKKKKISWLKFKKKNKKIAEHNTLISIHVLVFGKIIRQ